MADQPSMTSGSSVPTSNQSIPTTVPNNNAMDWSNGTRNNTTVSQVLISASPSSSINTTAMSSTSAVSSNNSQPGMVNSSPANTSTVTLVSTPTIKPNQPQQIIQQQQHTITTQSVQQIPQSSSTISSHQSSQPSSASTPQQGYTAAASGSNAGTLSGAVAGVPSTLGSSHVAQGGSPARAHLRTNTAADASKGLEKQRLAELIREVDPQTQVDEDVEEAARTTSSSSYCKSPSSQPSQPSQPGVPYLPTPDISHLTSADYEHVYEPAEDSFLFLDALTKEAEFLAHTLGLQGSGDGKSGKSNSGVCLEVGSGSGVVSTFIAQLLGSNVTYFCTEINPRAAEVTRQTARQNGVQLEVFEGDLVTPLEGRLAGKVDVLLFNPPYVVTPPEEVGSAGIEASWAGGDKGRQVLDRLLPSVPKLLSPRGVFYLVVIKENKPQEIAEILAAAGFTMETVMSRRSGPEFLSILKFTRSL